VADSELCCLDGERGDRGIRDSGASLIEILISIVLLGMSIAAMLGTLQVTIGASATERDHANAHAWLQTASDVLYRLAREDCGTEGATANEAAIRSSYQNQIRALADKNPEGWPVDKITVLQPVLFWDGTIYQNICYHETGLQLITIQVENMNDEIVETVQVVKG